MTKSVDKMTKPDLIKALINPSQFYSAEDHIAAFKRFKNLRAK